MVLQYYAFYLYYVRKALLKLCEDAPPLLRNYCFYITKFKYHLCYYLNLFAILAKGTVR